MTPWFTSSPPYHDGDSSVRAGDSFCHPAATRGCEVGWVTVPSGPHHVI